MTWLLIVCGLALTLVWVGYPLCMAALSAIRKHRPAAVPRTVPHVSVIIASADDDIAIRARVADVLASTYPADRLRVIVAIDYARQSGPSTGLETPEDRVTVVSGDAPGGKAAALNAGVRVANGEILVFTDTAQKFEAAAVTELVASLNDARLGAVSGALELNGRDPGHTIADLYWRYERWLRATEARVYSGVGVTGAIYAMRRELWKSLPSGLILDDVYTPMRLAMEGWRIGFNPRARAYDARVFTPAQEYRRKVRTLTGVIQLCAWMPSVLSPLRNPIWVQFMCHKLLRLLTPYLVALAVLALLSKGVAYAATPERTPIALAIAGAIAGILAIRPVRRAVVAHLAWAWALQTSAVAASVNGIRGRWDVWK